MLTVSALSFTELIEKAAEWLKRILPSKSLIEKVEAKADAAATFVEQGAKMVQSISDEIEEIANAAEMEAEEVEKVAIKVGEVTDRIKQIVDDVANAVEGEPAGGTQSLGQAADLLKQLAAAKKADPSSTD